MMKLQTIFARFGHQKETIKYVIGIACLWQGMPRDYLCLLAFPGVGPKVALVTIDECFKNARHMISTWYKSLRPSASTISLSDSWGAKQSSKHEFAQAAIEGWFPKSFWGQLNQTWAGLGQLFCSTSDTIKIAEWVDRQAKDWNSTLRLMDVEKITRIHGA
jgi:endonuclease III